MRIRNLFRGALAALALCAAPAAAQGRWMAAYPEAKDPVHAMMQAMFVGQDPLGSMVEPLNQYFPPSRDVTVELAECGRAGAFYDARRPAVQLCYELIMQLAEASMGGESEVGEEAFAGAFAIVLLHQVGHAMVDLLDLPVRVSPEEAADQLVAVMVGFAGDELASALDGALVLNELEIDWENPGSGRTALSGARLQNLLCLLYGANPEAGEWLVEEGTLSAARAQGCQQRYQAVQAEWLQMLSEKVAG